MKRKIPSEPYFHWNVHLILKPSSNKTSSIQCSSPRITGSTAGTCPTTDPSSATGCLPPSLLLVQIFFFCLRNSPASSQNARVLLPSICLPPMLPSLHTEIPSYPFSQFSLRTTHTCLWTSMAPGPTHTHRIQGPELRNLHLQLITRVFLCYIPSSLEPMIQRPVWVLSNDSSGPSVRALSISAFHEPVFTVIYFIPFWNTCWLLL